MSRRPPRPLLIVLLTAALGGLIWAPEAASLRADEPADETPAATDEPGDEDAAAEPEPLELRAELRNGMVLVGAVPFEMLRVQTAYGELTIPIEEVEEVRFGLVSAPAMGERIDGWIETALSGEDKKEREAACHELVKHGAISLSKLREAARADDVRSKKALEKAIADIESNGATEALQEDEIATDRFDLAGHVQLGTLRMQTDFGVMEVPQEALRRLSTARAPRRLKIAVASSFRGMSYFNAGVRVRRGEMIEIRASGQVSYNRVQTDRSHRSGGNMAFSPTGNSSFGTYQQKYVPGQLVMRIGGDAQPIVVGDHLRQKATRDGTLQFTIALDGDAGTGAYDLEIVVSPE